jgi:hypothetical protein
VFHLMFQAILSRGEELAINRKFDRNDHWLRELSRLEAVEKANARKESVPATRPSVLATIRSFVPFL